MRLKGMSVIFSCKQCSVAFDQVATYIEHKEANHFQEFVNTKCIVFEERTNELCHVQHKLNSCLPPVEMEVKMEAESECDSVDTSADSIVDANSADAKAVSADFDANQIRSTPIEPELLQNNQEPAKNLTLVYADEPDGAKEPSRPCLSSQVKTELTVFEIKQEIIPPFKTGEIQIEKPEISSVVTRKIKFTPMQEVQEAFSCQLENNKSLDLPVQSQEEMKEKTFSVRRRSRSKAQTEVRRSIRNKLVPFPALRIESAAEKIKVGNTSQSQCQNPAIKNNVQLIPLPKWLSVVEERENTSRLQTTSSAAIAKNVEITSDPRKPAELTETVKIESRPQKSSVEQKVEITSMPLVLLRRLKTTKVLLSKSEKQQNKSTSTTSKCGSGRLNEAKSKNYVCGICAKKFSWRRSLNRHNETHKTDENRTRPFKCPQCKKSFLLSYHLKDHLRRHSNKTPFKCSHSDCEKAFKTKTNLISHLKSHSDMRPFKCSVPNCDKAYRQKIDLKEHIRTHTCTGERNYICTVHPCSKGFLSHYQLKRHCLRVHAEKKVKPSPAACGKA